MPGELKITESPIPGLFVVNLPVHGDSRGWFKENWQNEKLSELGFPNFKPVQNNISYNDKIGTTRGIHAEPWDKYVSVATGKVFGAWVDLREGDSFGQVFTIEIDPSVAVYVPRGVGNAYQTLEPNTSYSYLVNAHWSPNAKYTFLNLADETANIQWPIPLKESEISDKDLNQPRMSGVAPFQPQKTVILGANGQLGKALQKEFPEAIALTRQEFDLANTSTWGSIDWNEIETIINAAAYTKVDDAEKREEKSKAWEINAVAIATLASKCEHLGIALVHISSDYVFDGNKPGPYLEEDSFSPLSVYGQSKTAGDLVVARNSRHYIVRTSWIVGNGPNFVSTMMSKSQMRTPAKVVSDQVGAITFATDLAKFIWKLLDSKAPFGTYNFTSGGTPKSWADIATRVFELTNSNGFLIQPITTKQYLKERRDDEFIMADRPLNSVLDLAKLKLLNFSNLQQTSLDEYVGRLLNGDLRG